MISLFWTPLDGDIRKWSSPFALACAPASPLSSVPFSNWPDRPPVPVWPSPVHERCLHWLWKQQNKVSSSPQYEITAKSLLITQAHMCNVLIGPVVCNYARLAAKHKQKLASVCSLVEFFLRVYLQGLITLLLLPDPGQILLGTFLQNVFILQEAGHLFAVKFISTHFK